MGTKLKAKKPRIDLLAEKMLVYFYFCRFTCTYEQRGKFLKKLWCCVGERVLQGNLVLSTELIA